MSDLTDIAGGIDELLAQMEAEKVAHLPTVGGEYDTTEGWAKRLGLSRGKMQELVTWLGCERRMARVDRGDSYYTCKVVYSPKLASEAAKRAG